MSNGQAKTPNNLVSFLTGSWENVSIEVSNAKPIKKEIYQETKVAKDAETLTIYLAA